MAAGEARSIAEAEEEKTDRSAQAKKLQEFYLALIDTGEEYPVAEWKRAWRQYAGTPEETDRPWVNLFRGQVDTLRSYLDQGWSAMRFLPAEGREEDPGVQGQAACDSAFMAYCRRELSLEDEAMRALLSCCVVNAGCVVRKWDLARMLPTVEAIRPEQVRWDPRCGGNPRRAGWQAYCKYISPETLHQETGIPVQTLRDAARKTKAPREGQVEGETEVVEQSQGKLDAEKRCRGVLDRCRVWSFFGRNEYALYDEPPEDSPGTSSQAEQSILAEDPEAAESEEGGPRLERFLDTQGLREPRRYLRIVEGLDDLGPVADEDDWPTELALDTDEWPVVWLSFNADGETVASFSDFRHVDRSNKAFENGLGEFDERLRLHLSVRWLLSRSLGKNRDEVERALKNLDRVTIPDALDERGNPLVKQMDLSDFPPALIDALKMWREVTDLASMQNEIMRGGEGEFNTAFEARMSREASTVKVASRVRAYRAFVAEIHRAILAMAHVMMPRLTTVEMFLFDKDQKPIGLAVEDGEDGKGLPWERVRELMRTMPGTEITELGVEAIVGPELAQHWAEKQPLEIIRRDLRVTLDEGGTQKTARLEEGAVLKELASDVLLSLYERAQRPDLAVELMRRILVLAGVAEVDALVPKPEDFQPEPAPTAPTAPTAPGPAAPVPGPAAQPVGPAAPA